MTLPSRPCFAVARRVAVALAVLLSGVVSSPTQADVLGDLTGADPLLLAALHTRAARWFEGRGDVVLALEPSRMALLMLDQRVRAD